MRAGMEPDGIIRYDGGFIRKFEELRMRIEAGDREALRGFWLENFAFVFKACMDCGKRAGKGDLREFDGADGETRRELARPLSHRQYRMVERAFKGEDGDAIWAAWDFLDDNGGIYAKKAMIAAEMGGFSLIWEQVCCRLARGRG